MAQATPTPPKRRALTRLFVAVSIGAAAAVSSAVITFFLVPQRNFAHGICIGAWPDETGRWLVASRTSWGITRVEWTVFQLRPERIEPDSVFGDYITARRLDHCPMPVPEGPGEPDLERFRLVFGWPLGWWSYAWDMTIEHSPQHVAWIDLYPFQKPDMNREPFVPGIPLRVLWTALTIDIAAWSGATWVLLTATAGSRRYLRRRADCCVNCGYRRAGLPVGTPCPECGEPPTHARRSARAADASSR